MRYALIENNRVKDIFVEPEGVSIEECFHADIVSQYIQCPDNIDVKDLYDPITSQFSEDPDKKYPSRSQWDVSFQNKAEEFASYSFNLNPTINNLEMTINRMDEYKKVLSDALVGVTDNVEIDNNNYDSVIFKQMIEALKTFESGKKIWIDNNMQNIFNLNSASEVENYDFNSQSIHTVINL